MRLLEVKRWSLLGAFEIEGNLFPFLIMLLLVKKKTTLFLNNSKSDAGFERAWAPVLYMNVHTIHTYL